MATRRNLAAAVLFAVPFAQAVDAAVLLDMRFGGTATSPVKTRPLTSADNGSTIPVYVYARVTGSLGSNTQFTGLGLTFAAIMAASAQASGLPIVAGSGNGFTTPFVLNANWTGTGSSGVGGFTNPATVANRNPAANSIYNAPASGPYGLADYGVVTVCNGDFQSIAVTTVAPIGVIPAAWGGGTIGVAVNPTDSSQGWEFPLGVLNFAVNSVNDAAVGSVLDFNFRSPTNFTPGTMQGSGLSHVVWYEDATSQITNLSAHRTARGFQTAVNNGTAGSNTSVLASFQRGTPISLTVVPEPTTLGITALAALALLTRRRTTR